MPIGVRQRTNRMEQVLSTLFAVQAFGWFGVIRPQRFGKLNVFTTFCVPANVLDGHVVGDPEHESPQRGLLSESAEGLPKGKPNVLEQFLTARGVGLVGPRKSLDGGPMLGHRGLEQSVLGRRAHGGVVPGFSQASHTRIRFQCDAH